MNNNVTQRMKQRARTAKCRKNMKENDPAKHAASNIKKRPTTSKWRAHKVSSMTEEQLEEYRLRGAVHAKNHALKMKLIAKQDPEFDAKRKKKQNEKKATQRANKRAKEAATHNAMTLASTAGATINIEAETTCAARTTHQLTAAVTIGGALRNQVEKVDALLTDSKKEDRKVKEKELKFSFEQSSIEESCKAYRKTLPTLQEISKCGTTKRKIGDEKKTMETVTGRIRLETSGRRYMLDIIEGVTAKDMYALLTLERYLTGNVISYYRALLLLREEQKRKDTGHNLLKSWITSTNFMTKLMKHESYTDSEVIKDIEERFPGTQLLLVV